MAIPIPYFSFLCNIIHYIYKNVLFYSLSLYILAFKFLVLYLRYFLVVYLSLYLLVHFYLFVYILLYYCTCCGFPKWVIYLYLDIIWEVPLGGRILTTSRHLGTIFIVPFILLFIYLHCSYMLVYLLLAFIFCPSPSPFIYCTLIIIIIIKRIQKVSYCFFSCQKYP